MSDPVLLKLINDAVSDCPDSDCESDTCDNDNHIQYRCTTSTRREIAARMNQGYRVLETDLLRWLSRHDWSIMCAAPSIYPHKLFRVINRHQTIEDPVLRKYMKCSKYCNCERVRLWRRTRHERNSVLQD